MLRWLIAILVLANLLVFAFASGLIAMLPASSQRELAHLNRQIHPDWLTVQPVSEAEAANRAVVGGAMPAAPVQASGLSQ